MSYHFIFSDTFQKDIKKMKKSGKYGQVKKKLEEIMTRPEEVGCVKTEILKHCRSVKMGHYIIVWAIIGINVHFLSCDIHDKGYDKAKKEARKIARTKGVYSNNGKQ